MRFHSTAKLVTSAYGIIIYMKGEGYCVRGHVPTCTYLALCLFCCYGNDTTIGYYAKSQVSCRASHTRCVIVMMTKEGVFVEHSCRTGPKML